MQNLDDAPSVRNALPGSDATAGAVGLWISGDGAQAYTATARGSVTTVDLASGVAQSVSCQWRADAAFSRCGRACSG